MATWLTPFLLGLLVTTGLLLPILLRFRTSAGEANHRAAAREREAGELRRGRAQMEEDQRSVLQFLKEFPNLARDLFGGFAERQLPPTLLHVLQKSLDPAQALVLVRRGQEADARFVVAAAYPEGGVPKVGTEMRLDRGEMGFVAESQLLASREDLATDEARRRIKPGPDALGGLQPQLIAPLVFDHETLGMIALSRPRRAVGDGKAALRLIAQTAAQALHAAAASARVRTTGEMDGLTRAFNKRHMEHALSDWIQRASAAPGERPGSRGAALAAVSIFLFDIDHFKHYNDTNGHLPGDKLLQELVRVVQDGVRKDDIFGRFGGEEFLLILPNTTLDQALGAANKVREAIAARKFPFAEKQPMGILSISGGVAEYPHDGTDVVGLLRAADAALYEAKRQGRNRVVTALTARNGLPAPVGAPVAPTPASLAAGAASPPFRSITDAGGPGKRA
jgi:diguanylate cyclase (GGDEF)-like protein